MRVVNMRVVAGSGGREGEAGEEKKVGGKEDDRSTDRPAGDFRAFSFENSSDLRRNT